ncbi:hypothetical protein BDW69DRAFT_193781 [Aspergillus filifer]
MSQEPVANFTRVINLDEHDDKEIKRAILPRMAGKYHQSLMIFDSCIPLPALPDIKTYKGFLEFYVRNTPCRIKEKPTAETVENFRRDFETALARMRDFCVPKAMSITMKEYIISDLKAKLAWCRDFKEYRSQYPDQSRVQLTASILLYCFSSAQTGKVHESTACRSIARQKDNGDDNNTKLWASVMVAYYKYFILTIEQVDGIPMLVLTYAWEFVKPSDLNLQTNHVISRIHFQKELLDTPVFRPSSELGCKTSTGRERGADASGKEFAALGCRSGYKRNITACACRQWALMETNKKYSQTARMKHASHTKAWTFGRSYAHPVCEVDGPATSLNIASRHEHIQNRRSMGIHRNPNLWQSLPAKADVQLTKAGSPETAHGIQLQRRRIQSQKDKLYLEELKRQRELQQGSQSGGIYEQTLFYYHRRAMPERDFLAQTLPAKSTIRSAAGKVALKMLESLCGQHHLVSYRSGLRPVNGKCVRGESIDR